MDRKKLHSLFWKTAKHGTHFGQPYSCALNAVLNYIEQEEKAMNTFVPAGGRTAREVSLEFSGNDCTLCVNGVKILTLSGGCLYLHAYVSSFATGLDVDRHGRVNVRPL